jgi:hypothetical protein
MLLPVDNTIKRGGSLGNGQHTSSSRYCTLCLVRIGYCFQPVQDRKQSNCFKRRTARRSKSYPFPPTSSHSSHAPHADAAYGCPTALTW